MKKLLMISISYFCFFIIQRIMLTLHWVIWNNGKMKQTKAVRSFPNHYLLALWISIINW
jgi:hypothetical protein